MLEWNTGMTSDTSKSNFHGLSEMPVVWVSLCGASMFSSSLSLCGASMFSSSLSWIIHCFAHALVNCGRGGIVQSSHGEALIQP